MKEIKIWKKMANNFLMSGYKKKSRKQVIDRSLVSLSLWSITCFPFLLTAHAFPFLMWAHCWVLRGRRKRRQDPAVSKCPHYRRKEMKVVGKIWAYFGPIMTAYQTLESRSSSTIKRWPLGFQDGCHGQRAQRLSGLVIKCGHQPGFYCLFSYVPG